jgi:hypothetical protein
MSNDLGTTESTAADTYANTSAVPKRRGLSLDSWAVLLALAAAALVKLHILNTVKW